MPKFYSFSPSSNLADVEIGQVFTHASGKKFMLVDRDPWKAITVRWTWLDAKMLKLTDWWHGRNKR